MINVTKASLPDFNEYIDEIRPLWDTHWITNMGEKHNEFKRELRAYLGADNLELFVNGHMALEMVLQSMNLSGEVITTPFTFASTTHAIVRNGLTPVYSVHGVAFFYRIWADGASRYGVFWFYRQTAGGKDNPDF